MKKLFKFSIASIVLSLLVGGGIFVLNCHKEVDNVDASDALTNLPHMVSDFNASTGKYWTSTSGSDLTPVSNHISSSTTGYRQDDPISITTYTTDYTDSYIRAWHSPSKGYKTMHAIYVPFHMDFNIPATSEYKLHLTFTVSANRAASGGGADYSAELFSYGEGGDATSGSYFYVPDDFTETTGDSYSVIRAANGVAHSSTSTNPVTKNKLITFTFSNATSAVVTRTLYFGLFAYVESSGTTTNGFEAKVRLNSATFDANYASYVCNGKNFMNDQFASAWSEFNGANNRTLELLADATAANDLVYNKSGGTLKLNARTLSLGNNIMYCNGSFTITATNSYGTITSSRDHSTLFLNAAATITLAGYATIENTHTAGSGYRAVLLANAGATLIVGPSNTIVSNNHCVWVDAGTLRINGGYLRNTNTSYLPVYTGTSESAKNVYVYGAATFTNATFSIASLDSNTNIYAKYSDAYYTGSSNISIHLRSTDNLALNQVGVRDVSSSNYSKFSLSPTNKGYAFTKSGSNLIVGYKTSSVTYNLTNMTSNGAATCTIGSDLSFTLSSNSGYALPNYITVKVASTTLTENTHYTYNSSTGAVVVYKENLTANVTVTASGLVEYTVTFVDEDGQAAEPIVVKGSKTISLPESDNEPAYHSTLWYDNPEYTGSERYPGSPVTITSNQTFYAKYTQTGRQIVQEFVGVELHFDVNVIPTSDERDTGACKGETGYYAVAKAKYNSLSKVCKELFCEDAEFANGRARFKAWANANGEDLNLSTYNIVSQSINRTTIDNDENSSFAVAIIVVAASALMLTTLIILKKKKSLR